MKEQTKKIEKNSFQTQHRPQNVPNRTLDHNKTVSNKYLSFIANTCFKQTIRFELYFGLIQSTGSWSLKTDAGYHLTFYISNSNRRLKGVIIIANEI